MAADITLKQSDTHVVVTDTLSYADGSAANLTGATVQFVMRALTSAAPLTLTGTTTITNPAAGDVQFSPSTADTGTAGEFMASWLVTFPDASTMTFPTVGYMSVAIEQNLIAVGGQQLIGLPDVKDYLNIGATERAHDAKLLRFIAAATPLIENITGPIVVRTIEEWHDGGQYWIRLRRRPSFALGTSPVLNIVGCDEYRGPTKYTLSVVPDPAAATIYSVMLEARTGTLYRRTTGGGVIPFGAGPWGGGMPDAVRVLYETGQETVPANVQEATLEAIRVNYETTMATGSGSRSFADEQDRTGPPLGFYLPRRCLELLAPLRRHPAIA